MYWRSPPCATKHVNTMDGLSLSNDGPRSWYVNTSFSTCGKISCCYRKIKRLLDAPFAAQGCRTTRLRWVQRHSDPGEYHLSRRFPDTPPTIFAEKIKGGRSVRSEGLSMILVFIGAVFTGRSECSVSKDFFPRTSSQKGDSPCASTKDHRS